MGTDRFDARTPTARSTTDECSLYDYTGCDLLAPKYVFSLPVQLAGPQDDLILA